MRTLKEYRELKESFIFDIIQNNPLISTVLTALVGGSVAALKRLHAYLQESARGHRFVNDLLDLSRMASKLGPKHPNVQQHAKSIIEGYKDLFSVESLQRQVQSLLDNS